MSQNKEIKTRLNTVKNISKVTKTMQMISATRMRKAINRVNESLPYTNALNDLILKLGSVDNYENVYTQPHSQVNNIGILVIGPSKGFVGSMLSTLNSTVLNHLKQLRLEYPSASITGISVHKLGLKILNSCGLNSAYHFGNTYDGLSASELVPLYTLLIDNFTKYKLDLIYLCYMNFTNALSNQAVISQLLPVKLPVAQKNLNFSDTLEPSTPEVIDYLIKEYFEKQVLTALLSSNATEHSIRMLAMKNATDNAQNLIQDLTLSYNKDRQAKITEQIIEVAGY